MIIIDQSPCYLFLEKFLNLLFSIQFLNILKIIIYFAIISLGSDLILVNIKFSIMHEIFKSSDRNPPKHVRHIFLHLSKGSDKVWHDGLIYEIQCNDITGNSLKLIESFLSNTFQNTENHLHGHQFVLVYIKAPF